MKTLLLISSIICSLALFNVAPASALPGSAAPAASSASDTILVKGGHGRGHARHGNRGRHLGWTRGRHRGWR